MSMWIMHPRQPHLRGAVLRILTIPTSLTSLTSTTSLTSLASLTSSMVPTIPLNPTSLTIPTSPTSSTSPTSPPSPSSPTFLAHPKLTIPTTLPIRPILALRANEPVEILLILRLRIRLRLLPPNLASPLRHVSPICARRGTDVNGLR
ncbi:hypothetical protein DACRYDRAFT_20180 [Dacryopinax primogenitus]|uniref:Uncharacterized protein n=1 Tax=Dacryopinax primogenitus (strain DJM 731) TaxID=1858805 RepID=M5GEY3_DACPD|nr:uncharacterized protein DACRYDRAFT_20180 [Dacryopinax primogenitus]EJU05807.1 hypothetical protein DACRYDRAFT_20180 [Dacryopinax primogenitus]